MNYENYYYILITFVLRIKLYIYTFSGFTRFLIVFIFKPCNRVIASICIVKTVTVVHVNNRVSLTGLHWLLEHTIWCEIR